MKSLVLNRLGAGAVAFATFFAFCPLSPSAALAQGNDWARPRYHHRVGGGPFEAPELDAATAAQGLVLIGGALVLLRRRYRRGQ